MKIIDLSVPIVHGLPVDPPFLIAQIDYMNHEQGADSILKFFPGAEKEDLLEGYGWATEDLKVTSHSGTHMDAPWHYHPTMNGGEPSWTIDQVPLEWCIGNGIMVDFHEKPDGYVCTPKDFQDYFDKVGYTVTEGDILLLRTSAMDAWGTPEYLAKGCGVGWDATIWLAKQGIRVVGTDAWSWDAPLCYEAEAFQKTGDKKVIWEGHKAGSEIAYCQMEKLTNLEKLPPFGFTVIALPVKIQDASAGWCRCVAILPEE